MLVKEMTVSQWIAVPPNPIQRDTERHAKKAKHLLTPLPVHAVVFAAQMPDGSLVKLDGHTRAYLWKRGDVTPPPRVICNITMAKTIEDVKALYQTFDAREALETPVDKVSGAFAGLKFKPESSLLLGGSLATSMRLCWNVLHEIPLMTHASVGYSIYSSVTEFGNELFMLDSYDLKPKAAPNGIVAAFVLTYRKYNADALSFWTPFFANEGQKGRGKMNAVQALHEYLLKRRGTSDGRMGMVETAARAVSGVERFRRGDELSAVGLKEYNLVGYLDNVTPSKVLMKRGGFKA